MKINKKQVKLFEKKGILSKENADIARNILSRKNNSGAGSPPQEILWAAIEKRWPDEAVQEFDGIVPGRKFRADIAFPSKSIRLIVEVDGWQFHGRYLLDFKKDRIRQNLLTLNNWRVLRYFPETIFKNMPFILNEIETAILSKDASNA